MYFCGNIYTETRKGFTETHKVFVFGVFISLTFVIVIVIDIYY